MSLTGKSLKSMLKDNPPPSGAPKGVRFEQRIGIQVPAAKIWAHLTDFERWPQWADVYAEVTGSFEYGGRICLIQALPNHAPRPVDAKIVDWEPEAQIVWRDAVQFGVWTTRYLEIDALSDSGSIFTTGEIVSGPLAPFWLKTRGFHLREAMIRQAEAMKVLAEL